jgi:hypothetical protein
MSRPVMLTARAMDVITPFCKISSPVRQRRCQAGAVVSTQGLFSRNAYDRRLGCNLIGAGRSYPPTRDRDESNVALRAQNLSQLY